MAPLHLFHTKHRRWRTKPNPKLPIIILFVFVINRTSSECCYSRQLSSSSLKCGDGTPLAPRGQYYCGHGPCNIFGCNCDGGCRTSASLRFKRGDIIACEMVGLIMGIHTVLTFGQRTLFHTMLAINDHEVVHVSVYLEGSKIKREPFYRAKNDKMHCHIETDFFDEQAAYYWDIRPFDPLIVAARAEAYELANRGRKVRYDAIEKNCEHWVTFWRYGIGFNLQLHPGQPTLNSVLRYFGLKPKLAQVDNFEAHHRISWNGTLLPVGASAQWRSGKAHTVYVGPLFQKPKYSGICWRNLDCYSRRCDRTDVFGHEFGYCEVIKLG